MGWIWDQYGKNMGGECDDSVMGWDMEWTWNGCGETDMGWMWDGYGYMISIAYPHTTRPPQHPNLLGLWGTGSYGRDIRGDNGEIEG